MNIELITQKPWKKWTAISLFVLLLAYATYAMTSQSTKSVSVASLSI